MPILFASGYVFCCILFDQLFLVPGSISFNAILTFLLPYLGCSSAFYLFRSKSLFWDFDSKGKGSSKELFLFEHIPWLVLFSLFMQIITWIFILLTVDNFNTVTELFSSLRNASIEMRSIVPIWLSYPNGLCFASFCLAYSFYRCQRKINSLILLTISVLTIFLNDLQTSGRAGMAFVIFVFLVSSLWDWKVSKIKPFKFLSGIFIISIFTQLPKILRDDYQSIAHVKILFIEVMRYSFSYLNTLSEFLNRLPDPNWIGERTFLPFYNLISRVYPLVERSGIHSIERSEVWGYNNYTIAGDLLRDFSYLGCFVIPFLVTFAFLFFGTIASRPLNIAITAYFSGWLVFGSITNILILGGFLVSLIFLFFLAFLESFYFRKRNLI